MKNKGKKSKAKYNIKEEERKIMNAEKTQYYELNCEIKALDLHRCWQSFRETEKERKRKLGLSGRD